MNTSPPSGGTQALARILGGRFVNGAKAFDGLDSSDFEQHWLPYDGHWNQRGSDRFARFIAGPLEAWLAGEGARESTPAQGRM